MFEQASIDEVRRRLLAHPFLSHLYDSIPEQDAPFAEIHADLRDALDPLRAVEQRTRAALRMSEFTATLRVGERDDEARRTSVSFAALAATLGSAQGARAYANLLLAEYRLELKPSDPLNGGLPMLRRLSETERGGVESTQLRTRTRRPDEGAIRAPISAVAQWLAGATTTLSRTPTATDPWEREERAAALECLINWLTIVPIGCDPREVARSRLHAMSGWVRPAWRNLKWEHSGASREADSEWALIRAQLEGWCDPVGAEATPMQDADQPQTDRYHLVLRTPIAPSQDRYDREYLESYSVLTRPLPVAGDASRETLWELARRLGAEFPWAHNVVQAVVGEMMACATYGVSRGLPRPVLLVGRPGSGKTRFAVRLAELLGVPNTIINLAGMHDAKLLKGTTRGWASARPSRIVEFLAQARVANPLFVMDEIDKMSDQTDCYAQHALLDLLESANAARYHDVFLLAECDLSRCQYIATANSLASLSRALVSRFHVVVFPYPGAEYAGAVVKQVVADLEREWGLTASTIDLLGFDVQVCHGLPPRAIRQILMNWIGQKALTRSWLH